MHPGDRHWPAGLPPAPLELDWVLEPACHSESRCRRRSSLLLRILPPAQEHCNYKLAQVTRLNHARFHPIAIPSEAARHRDKPDIEYCLTRNPTLPPRGHNITRQSLKHWMEVGFDAEDNPWQPDLARSH